MLIKRKDGSTFGFSELPQWIPARKLGELPLYMKAVSPPGENLWFLYRVAIVGKKWTLLHGRMLKLDWARIGGINFTSKEKAVSTARIIAADNRNTPQHRESDVIHSKTLVAK